MKTISFILGLGIGIIAAILINQSHPIAPKISQDLIKTACQSDLHCYSVLETYAR